MARIMASNISRFINENIPLSDELYDSLKYQETKTAIIVERHQIIRNIQKLMLNHVQYIEDVVSQEKIL